MISLSDSYKSNIPLFVSPRLLLGKIKKRNLNKSIPLHELSVIEKTYDRYIHFNMPSDFVESLSNREYANELKLFASTLINNFNDNDLYNMYLNMDTLTINNFDYDKYNSDSNIAGSLAFYKPLNNELYISDKNGSGAIYHELFHMATSNYVDDLLYSGLEQATFDEDKGIIEIGNGINEGYTQLLAERYFKDAFKDAYILFKHQLKFVEEVIGKQLMESLYMRSDLLGFVLELRKYSTYEDISRFITYYDFLLRYTKRKNLNKEQLKLVAEMTRYINEYTIALLINKAIVNGINTDEEQDMLVDDVNRFIERSVTCLNYDDGHQIDCDIYYDSEFIKNIDKELNNFGIKAKRLL